MSSIIILRLLHVIIGALWVGFIVFLGTMMLPTMRAIGGAGAPVMRHITQVRRLPLWMMVMALTTVITGFMLAMHDAGDQGMAWFQVGMGRTIGIGAVAAVLGVIIGMGVTSPAAKRLSQLMGEIAGRAPSAEEVARMQALQQRMGIGTTLVMVLVLIAIACMSVARYTL